METQGQSDMKNETERSRSGMMETLRVFMKELTGKVPQRIPTLLKKLFWITKL